MLSDCKSLGAKTDARVRDPEYNQQSAFMRVNWGSAGWSIPIKRWRRKSRGCYVFLLRKNLYLCRRKVEIVEMKPRRQHYGGEKAEEINTGRRGFPY
ncbi:MAG: hypothetical protein ACLRSW_02220 [Christensenellaceae bacterium]